MIVFLDVHQYAGRGASGAYPKCLHQREDDVTLGLFSWAFLWGEMRGHYREFQPLLDDSQRGQSIEPGANFLRSFVPAVTAASGALACSWPFEWRKLVRCFLRTRGTISVHCGGSKETRSATWRSPWAFGTIIVITLYCLANLGYLCTLPLVQIQNRS